MDKNDTALYAFRKYADTVLRAAYACTGDLHEAEDITQDIFLSLHTSPPEFRDDGHMKAYLLRAAVNRSVNYKKSFRRSRTSSIEEKGDIASSEDVFSDRSGIRDIIRQLPEKYRSVIFLYYYEGYNIREIAGILGKNENTVSSLLRRARNKLKIRLDEEGYHEDR